MISISHESSKISVYIINLIERKERLKHCQCQFKNKNEFDITVIEACKSPIGAMGLWNSIIKIIKLAIANNQSIIIICEDDHQFTEYYSEHFLQTCICEAQQKDADILSGGVSWFMTGIQISNNLFWIEKFSGFQFTIIFKKFYDKILNADFEKEDSADYKISSLSENKFVIYPFISTQKEFGYSDATKSNNQKGFVSKIFRECSERFELLKKVSNFYQAAKQIGEPGISYENICITPLSDNIILPVYIINLKERKDRLAHITKQFEDKSEFEIHIVEGCKHELGTFGLWKSIINIVKIALENKDDFIIVCEDDHLFTKHYDKSVLIKNIIEANLKGVELLSGGVSGGFSHIVPVSKCLFWLNYFWGLQFIVIYSSLFQKILDFPFTQKDTADGALSEITSNKMVIYPFISIQRNFGYSDVTKKNDLLKNWVTDLFIQSNAKMEVYKNIYEKYVLKEKISKCNN